MATICGHFEYDDRYTPGKVKGGGLHQNLFDDEGKLRAHGRFVPDEGPVSESYVPTPSRDEREDDNRLTTEELEQVLLLLERVVLPLLVVAIERGAPAAQRLWLDRVRPAVRARLHGLKRRLPHLPRRANPGVTDVLQGTVMDTLHTEPSRASGAEMEAAEAEARRLLAVALRHASDEQLRLLAEATILPDHAAGPGREVELKRGDLPGDAAPLMRRLSTQPASLTGVEALTAIRLLLGDERTR